MAKAAKKLPVKTVKSAKYQARRQPGTPSKACAGKSIICSREFRLRPHGHLRRTTWDIGTARPNWAVAIPAMDVTMKDGSYEISAELPGMDENNVELKLADEPGNHQQKTEERKEEEKIRALLARTALWLLYALGAFPDDAISTK